jgi:amino acid transporter
VVVTRRIVTAVALAFTAFFAFLTLYDAVENGVSFLTIVSLGVLALLAIGILGALSSQGPDE